METSEEEFQMRCARELHTILLLAGGFPSSRDAHFLVVLKFLSRKIKVKGLPVDTIAMKADGDMTGEDGEFKGAVACLERLVKALLAAGRLDALPDWELVRVPGGGKGRTSVHQFRRRRLDESAESFSQDIEGRPSEQLTHASSDGVEAVVPEVAIGNAGAAVLPRDLAHSLDASAVTSDESLSASIAHLNDLLADQADRGIKSGHSRMGYGEVDGHARKARTSLQRDLGRANLHRENARHRRWKSLRELASARAVGAQSVSLAVRIVVRGSAFVEQVIARGAAAHDRPLDDEVPPKKPFGWRAAQRRFGATRDALHLAFLARLATERASACCEFMLYAMLAFWILAALRVLPLGGDVGVEMHAPLDPLYRILVDAARNIASTGRICFSGLY